MRTNPGVGAGSLLVGGVARIGEKRLGVHRPILFAVDDERLGGAPHNFVGASNEWGEVV